MCLFPTHFNMKRENNHAGSFYLAKRTRITHKMLNQKELINQCLRITMTMKDYVQQQLEMGKIFMSAEEYQSPYADLSMEELRACAFACTKCPLHENRTNVVFGAGNPEAELVFVGEAPGREEDLQGEPFVGAAGRLLTKIINAIDLTRDEVYITNVVKCRPPENRNPKTEEIEHCMPFLLRQVEIIKPKIICALGSVAAHSLLDTDQGITKIRGKFYDVDLPIHTEHRFKLMPTFHPAYLLYNEKAKRPVWEDMKIIRAELQS